MKQGYQVLCFCRRMMNPCRMLLSRLPLGRWLFFTALTARKDSAPMRRKKLMFVKWHAILILWFLSNLAALLFSNSLMFQKRKKKGKKRRKQIFLLYASKFWKIPDDLLGTDLIYDHRKIPNPFTRSGGSEFLKLTPNYIFF